MSLPPEVRRCPYCRGPVYLRWETLLQYRVVLYGCSNCELAIHDEDFVPEFSSGMPEAERLERLGRFRETLARAGLPMPD